jgi:16S rRNA (uracil1498-N3)-methyltransferase
MTRIFLDVTVHQKTSISISGEKAHYLSTVLRRRTGDSIIVTDRSGSSYAAGIRTITKNLATLEIGAPLLLETESPLEIILIQGLLKGEKMDLVVQKATELGVKKIVPVISERSQLRETRKLSRWQKIAEEASRQCGRNKVPAITEPEAFGIEIRQGLPAGSSGIIFWEQGGVPWSSSLGTRGKKQMTICIGPEGGFSSDEVKTAEDLGFVIVSLGKRVLRAETAAIAALSIVQYELGDMGLRDMI